MELLGCCCACGVSRCNEGAGCVTEDAVEDGCEAGGEELCCNVRNFACLSAKSEFSGECVLLLLPDAAIEALLDMCDQILIEGSELSDPNAPVKVTKVRRELKKSDRAEQGYSRSRFQSHTSPIQQFDIYYYTKIRFIIYEIDLSNIYNNTSTVGC